MKKIKGLFIVTILLCCVVIGINTNKEVNASGLVVMKDHNGNDMTYRNSSEKIYQLEEYNYPTNQLRAVWISAFVGDVPSYKSESQFKSAVTNVLDNCVSMGMNAVVYHLRTHNNAMYKSELNPLAKWYDGVDFDTFDPTAWVIDECHKRGIEFHAWLNPYRVSSNGSIPYNTVGELPECNPANDVANLITVDKNIILDPGIPSNRDFIVDTCMEIVENYDVDAIHFDDYFYISGTNDAATRAKYNTENLSVGDFRRKQVDLFIESLSNELREYNSLNNKTVQLGISPSGIYQNGSYKAEPKYDSNGNLISPVYSNTSGFSHYGDYLYSDTLNWINNEWIDYIMPQCYWASEHAAASYLELTKWWSWAVRHKNVNFYTGMGIYMALDTSSSSGKYWGYNVDEIEKQLLNAAQYAEFGGACFYKYSSLTTLSNSTIKYTVDLISNDFWNKRIPGAVQKYYAPLVDEVTPTNVAYDQATNTISFDKVDNVRGYMIYQVPKGDNLDKSNIDHVYQYIQDTSIVVGDTSKYDYYVASVNLANETSEVASIILDLNADTVIDRINNLPTTITYENKLEIENIRKLYNLLDDEQKQAVTNLNKLVDAEAVIASYKGLETKIDNYLSTLDLHIKVNRIIPTLEGMTLSYKNITDSNIYNITTGERLKNYLNTKEITLILTLTENGLTFSKEFNVNLGYVATNQTGLFYRNDASCMNPDDEGIYIEDGSGYIGWSGHTVVVDNVVLFVSENNYHEITDPSYIPSCKWTSVAGVYVNKTGGVMSIKMTDAFSGKSSNSDGYFVISNNQIKELHDGFDDSVTVSLNPNEAFIIVRYLDAQINGNIMCPVSNLTVGQTAYIDEFEEETPEQQAQKVVALINTIPSTISLSDEALINNINTTYNKLSDEAKELVTNKDVLTNALNTINTLKQELLNYKNDAITLLNNYLDKTLYSDANVELIDSYLTSAAFTINNAASKDEIDTVVNNIKNELDNILTLVEELAKAKQDAILELDSYVNLDDYNASNQLTIKSYIDSAKTNINNATTLNDVATILNNAKTSIDNIQTIAEEEAYLQSVRDMYFAKIDELLASYQDISEAEFEIITGIANNFKEQINRSTTEGDIRYMWTRCEANVREYFENLESSRIKVEEQLLDYVSKLTYGSKEVEYITSLANEKIEFAKTCVELDVINNIVEEFILYVDELHDTLVNAKKVAITTLNNLISPWYTTSQVEYITSLIEVATPLINDCGKLSDVETLEEEYSNQITTYITELEDAINDALTYLNSLKDSNNTEITTLINSYRALITNASTKDDVTSYLTSFNEAYDEIINRPEPIIYVISFNTNGGNETYDSISLDEEQSYTLPIPTREGYVFSGWFFNDQLITDNTWPLNPTTTLVAKWELIKYTITFDSNGGNEIDPIVNVKDALIVLPRPTKEGYKFTGWYLNEERYTTVLMPGENITLVAKWESLEDEVDDLETMREIYHDIVSKYKTNTKKAEELKQQTLNDLKNATSLEELEDIMLHFDNNFNDYNKKSNCKNNTYIYLNLLLALGCVLILRKKK